MGGLFGGMKLPPLPGVISGYGGGTFNVDGTQATPVGGTVIPTGDFGPRPSGIDEAAAYTGPAKKGGLFGSKFNEPGGWGEKLALIGSVLTQDGGNNPMVQQILQRRAQDYAIKQQALQQQQELARQVALYDYKRQNPDLSEFDRALQAGGVQEGTPDWQKYQLQRALSIADPTVTVPLGPNRIYSGPRSGLGAALGAGAPTGNLDGQPTVEDGYVYTPGPGGRANQANWKPQGGPASRGGMFP